MGRWFVNGEILTAKEIREIGEEYLGACTWHLPVQSICNTLKQKGFQIEYKFL